MLDIAWLHGIRWIALAISRYLVRASMPLSTLASEQAVPLPLNRRGLAERDEATI